MKDKLREYFDRQRPDPSLENRVREKIERGGQPRRKRGPRFTAKLVTASVFTALVVFFVLAGAITLRVSPGTDRVRRFSTRAEVVDYGEELQAQRAKTQLSDGLFKSFRLGCGSPDKSGTAPFPGGNDLQTDLGPEGNGNSQTNTQVAGVDEADIVKIDKDGYLYSSHNRPSNRVCVTRVADGEVTQIPMDDFAPGEIFVYGDRLVVFGKSYDSSGYGVRIYDVTDKAAPVEVRRLAFRNAYYVSSRRVDGSVYLVLNNNAWYKDDSVEIPTYYDSLEGTEKEFSPQDIYAVPGGAEFVCYTYLVAFDVAGSQPLKKKAYFGSVRDVYATADAVYTASPRYVYSRNLLRGTTRSADCRSILNRFSLEQDLELVSTGEVEGYTRDKYCMDESGGYFRVAVTRGEGLQTDAAVYVLDYSEEQMRIVGRLEGMGKGERIYSCRFSGGVCYLVTARQTDPLFVVDLTNPEQPVLRGELKIPDVSDYLHEYDENTLLGIGRKGGGGEFGSFTGIKLSLFDVSDPENPKKKCEDIDLGRSSWSDVAYNPKALLYYTDAASGRTLFGFHVYTEEPGEFYRAYGCVLLFEVTQTGISRVAELRIANRDGGKPAYGRAVVIGGDLYVVSDQNVVAYKLDFGGGAISAEAAGRVIDLTA